MPLLRLIPWPFDDWLLTAQCTPHDTDCRMLDFVQQACADFGGEIPVAVHDRLEPLMRSSLHEPRLTLSVHYEELTWLTKRREMCEFRGNLPCRQHILPLLSKQIIDSGVEFGRTVPSPLARFRVTAVFRKFELVYRGCDDGGNQLAHTGSLLLVWQLFRICSVNYYTWLKRYVKYDRALIIRPQTLFY